MFEHLRRLSETLDCGRVVRVELSARYLLHRTIVHIRFREQDVSHSVRAGTGELIMKFCARKLK